MKIRLKNSPKLILNSIALVSLLTLAAPTQVMASSSNWVKEKVSGSKAKKKGTAAQKEQYEKDSEEAMNASKAYGGSKMKAKEDRAEADKASEAHETEKQKWNINPTKDTSRTQSTKDRWNNEAEKSQRGTMDSNEAAISAHEKAIKSGEEAGEDTDEHARLLKKHTRNTRPTVESESETDYSGVKETMGK